MLDDRGPNNAFDIAVPPVLPLSNNQPPVLSASTHPVLPPLMAHSLPTPHFAHTNATTTSRSTIDRARQLVDHTPASETTSILHDNESMVPGMILDAESNDENDTLVHGEGLGEEDDADLDQAKTEFPGWLTTQFNAIRDDIAQGKIRPGTFWIRSPQTTWSLLRHSNLTPDTLFTANFFIWDPLAILSTNFHLRCPNKECNHYLTRYGIVGRPRRVVEIDDCFWLIGYNYGCRKSPDGCGLRLRSWDQRVLDQLPPELADEFPAYLTWRSGLSKQAFGVVRSCFQYGVGSAELSDLFRMQHLRRYDKLRLQYLRAKYKEMLLGGQFYEVFPPFQDRSARGYHGFTPSGQWLRDLYDGYIESKRDTINQHMAMLSARICAIDHSHKLAKHVFKVDGVPIFTALLTVTNEKGEIRVCVFVATKSHSQFDDALRRLADDLVVYGHNLPEVFYTDNMVDKAMLERIFPSLLENVVPVDKYAHLPLLETPDFVRNPTVLDDEAMINNAMRAILDDVPAGRELVIGFDSEWNVDMTQYGRFGGRSPPAVLQIAYQNSVFILKVGEMLSRQRLPEQLVNLLRHSQVVKAGRQVNADLRRLAAAAGFPADHFPGALDLAMFAKERFLIKKATLSLADLIASLLNQSLPKPFAERISSNWSDSELSQAQLEYAARDAYASLLLYNEIVKTPRPSSGLDTLLLPGTSIMLLTDDNKQTAAEGVISPNASLSQFQNTNITATRTVVTIQKVLTPGAIIGINKDSNGNKLSLSHFGVAPFDILAHRSHIRIVSSMAQPLDIDSNSSSISTDVLPSTETADGADDDLVSALEGLDDGDIDDSPPITPNLAEADAESAAVALETLGPEAPPSWAFAIRSRILKDIFHVFHMIYISRMHGLRLAFINDLRDACLIPHPTDKARIEIYLATRGLTWADMLRYNPKWLWRHCRRTIPPPEELYPLVHRVFMLYGPLKDAKTGLPLFNSAAWKIAKNILELVRNGHVSDVPGVALYFLLGFDKKAGGLPLYRCIRGTNMVEGGVHTHLLAKLPSRGASVRHMVACLLDFVLRHNLTVGHFNSTGRKFAGHDSIWLSNKIQELEIALGEHYNKAPLSLPWVNGNLYVKSKQTVGIIHLPASVCSSVDIQPFRETHDTKQKQAYLAKMQGTRKPVLPVHTVAEKKLFTKLMLTSTAFQRCKTSISTEATIEWNRVAAETADIYYKLEEQLTAYFNGPYKDSANIRISCARVQEQTAPLQKELDNRTTYAVHAPASELVAPQVTSGFTDEGPHVPTESESTYAQQHAASHAMSISAASQVVHTSKKRAAEDALHGQPAPKKARNGRSCIRCGREDGCAGRGSWFLCTNPCRDCGRKSTKECVGRTSKNKTRKRCSPQNPYPPSMLEGSELTDKVCRLFGLARHEKSTQKRLELNK
ncbi:3'-5' exonuclease domain-containing protein [Mycena indigotica]|uniref:3'-5' exonuclease n=1 Tax=Mycena indigotica TaxID=2126181 RepID=A0A8H6S5Q7_9AGAR|nr:3'-5' exonuclease domain-containing protein [Mycena indigotica]KAF7293600.1 3'-5' exonuclease domain-containing protein [Mycena indigotica]